MEDTWNISFVFRRDMNVDITWECAGAGFSGLSWAAHVHLYPAHIQWWHVGSLKWAPWGEFTPWKLAHITNQSFLLVFVFSRELIDKHLPIHPQDKVISPGERVWMGRRECQRTRPKAMLKLTVQFYGEPPTKETNEEQAERWEENGGEIPGRPCCTVSCCWSSRKRRTKHSSYRSVIRKLGCKARSSASPGVLYIRDAWSPPQTYWVSTSGTYDMEATLRNRTWYIVFQKKAPGR